MDKKLIEIANTIRGKMINDTSLYGLSDEQFRNKISDYVSYSTKLECLTPVEEMIISKSLEIESRRLSNMRWTIWRGF